MFLLSTWLICNCWERTKDSVTLWMKEQWGAELTSLNNTLAADYSCIGFDYNYSTSKLLDLTLTEDWKYTVHFVVTGGKKMSVIVRYWDALVVQGSKTLLGLSPDFCTFVACHPVSFSLSASQPSLNQWRQKYQNTSNEILRITFFSRGQLSFSRSWRTNQWAWAKFQYCFIYN